MNAIQSSLENHIVDLLVSSPPPGPPPPSLETDDFIDNTTFFGLVFSVVYLCIISMELSELEQWSDAPYFQIIGALLITASYLLGFLTGVDNTSHGIFVSFAVMAIGKHLAERNELPAKVANILAMCTLIPGIFLLAYKEHVFHLAQCSSMRMLLVLSSLVPFTILIRTLKEVGYDREKRILRIKLIGLYLLILMYHTIVDPRHMCLKTESAKLSLINLIFDFGLLGLAYT
jgi:uncharacterized membrane protein YjjB (DUF3815 family)